MLFQHLDTVLAFAMIMLLLSVLITVVVQLVVSVTGLRGRNLNWAVTELLRRVGSRAAAKEEAQRVLREPVLATSTNRLLQFVDWILARLGYRPRFNGGRRPPTHVRAKDLALVFHDLDVDVGADRLSKATAQTAEAVVNRVEKAVELIEARITDWFDLVMTAAGARFKLWTRWITVAGAIGLAFVFQIDSLEILRRLSADPALRASVIEQADEVGALYRTAYGEALPAPASGATPPDTTAGAAAAPAAAATGTDRQPAPDPPRDIERAAAAVDSVLAQVYKTQLVALEPIDQITDLQHDLLGRTVTVLLLTLGAPFWYSAIGKLVGFRAALRSPEKTPEDG